ncbi:unnamed protein product [Adineta steineri]|uniref:SSD domain-containing protein n=1 Tax=Adineta steineri TaxID=433720 RepID=A0A814EM25_9BILA|nr:unnamed protein product [Adineta steineri]CAF3891380.1 unnamed protein product [Adineta steineri]
MGIISVQEKTNKFWDNYSKFLIRFSWIILILSLIITVGLTICLLCLIQIRPFDQTDFIVRNGRASKNAQLINKVFGSDKDVRTHQQMDLYPALDVIIKRKINHENINETNMLNNQIIEEIRSLDKLIHSIQINDVNNSKQYNYTSLCAIINRACMIDGNYLLSDKFHKDALNLRYVESGIYFDSLTGANGLASFIFGKDFKIINATLPEVDYDEEEEEEEVGEPEDLPVVKHTSSEKTISYVPIFRIRYSLNISNDHMRHLSTQWEREVLHYLNEKYQSNLIEISPSTSTAITDTVGKQARDEGPFMAIMLLIFFIFVGFFISIQGNFHTSVGYLSICGVLNLALATGATFGLLSVFKIQIIEPMALIIFVVAIIESMRISIVCGEYHQIIKEYLPVSSINVSTKIDIEKILPSIIKSTRPYFLSSTLIIMITYVIMSIISPMSCTRYLGLTIVLYIFIEYITHCTFFASCLVITLKRIKSRRHCLLCHQLPNDYYIKDRRKSLSKTLNKQVTTLTNVDPIFKKIFTGFLCLLSVIFIICSIWLISSIDTRLYEDKFLPKNASTLKSYMRAHFENYDIGPVIMFVIPKPMNYENKKNQLLIHNLVAQCLNETAMNNKFKLVWLEQEDLNDVLTSRNPLSVRLTPYSQNDLVISDKKNRSVIKASRFFCQYRSTKGDRNDLQAMYNMYTYAEQSSLPSIFPYSFIFLHYESLAQIRREVYLLTIFTVTTTFLITFVIFLSFGKALLIFTNLLALLTGSLACLYLFHNLTFNFANSLWLFVIPVIFLDTLIHASFNITKSKWKYNRVILSLLISLCIFSLFSIETYIYHVIRQSLIYQSIICFILINFILPSWYYIIETVLKKNKNDRQPVPTENPDVIQPVVAGTEIQNLVYEPNGNMNNSV